MDTQYFIKIIPMYNMIKVPDTPRWQFANLCPVYFTNTQKVIFGSWLVSYDFNLQTEQRSSYLMQNILLRTTGRIQKNLKTSILYQPTWISTALKISNFSKVPTCSHIAALTVRSAKMPRYYSEWKWKLWNQKSNGT